MYSRRAHTAPAIHFFVKIAIFELLYFLEFEADLNETSNFCQLLYGETTYGSCFSFHLKISDVIKRDLISKKGY